ncbi:VOC family protein [Streptomyces sp. M10(2022)]
MASPQKLAHVVLYSSQVPVMRDWYLKVLDAHVVFETPAGSSSPTTTNTTASRSPHRTLPRIWATERRGWPAGTPRGPFQALGHIAFTYASLRELLENWERLAAESVLPFLAVNHGPTTSMYYADPDGNHIELQIDNFATVEEGTAFMQSDSFARNLFGETFEPADKLAELRAGATVSELVTPTW